MTEETGVRRRHGGVVVRVEDAGPGAVVRVVVSGVSDPGRLGVTTAADAAPERRGDRLRVATTVDALVRAAGRALPPEEAGALESALRQAVVAWHGPAPPLALPGGRSLATDTAPRVMGVVNVTPDSFSDGGLLYPDGHPASGAAHARRLADEGADVLDVGGMSTRPGADDVAEDEELRRVVPVLESLGDVAAVRSVDTTRPAVAAAAVAAGADIVNDVSTGRDPRLLETVAATGAGYVLMHSRGTPRDMQTMTGYDDVVAEVYEQLAAGLSRCAAAGIDSRRVVVDPGIGFAKTAAQNLLLLRAVRQFRGLGRPLLVGASRKSFLGPLLGDAGVDERLEASLACAALAVREGASLLRVHDVAATVRAVRVADAVAGAAG